MNIEQTKEAIKVMQAYVDRVTIFSTDKERPNKHVAIIDNPAWNWAVFNYFIKPEPKLRPWKPEEVPLGAWMRGIDSDNQRWMLTNSMNEDRRREWLLHNQHSTDQGKTWLPCGVEE